MKQTLYQYLAQSGLFGNRKELLRALKKGKVKIDGRKVTRPKFQFNPNTRQVTYNDKPVQLLDFVYYALNKPLGYVSQKNDYQKRPYVLDLLKGKVERRILNSLALAGRLDMDTSGLMIATNDGDFIHKLMSPGNVIKKYEVMLDKAALEPDIQKIKQGVMVKAEEETYIAKAIIYSAKANKLTLGITEGRKRQVKLMFKSLGYEITSLRRISIGRLELRHLREGEWMQLDKQKLFKLFGEQSHPGQQEYNKKGSQD